MQTFIQIPNLFLKNKVSDNTFLAAYNNFSDKERSWLKTCLARQHAILGESKTKINKQEIFRQGFCLATKQEPLDFVIVCMPADFSAGVRLIAALAPAVLAGVKNIYILYVQDEPNNLVSNEPNSEQEKNIASSILVAIELLGLACADNGDEIGHLFTVSQTESLDFLNSCILQAQEQSSAQNSVQGKLLMLGNSFWGEKLIIKAAQAGISVWSKGMQELKVELPNTINTEDSRKVNIDDFKLNHPELKEFANTPKEHQKSSTLNFIQTTELAIGAGQEGVWFWSELNLEFFNKYSFAISTSDK